MQCPDCSAVLEDNTIYCGNCGKQIAPLQAPGATLGYAARAESRSSGFPGKPSPFPPLAPVLSGATVVSSRETPPVLPVSSSGRRRPLFLGIIILLLVVLAGATVLTVALTKNGHSAIAGSGQVSFFDGANGAGNTDALSLAISGLSEPPTGSQYDAWLVDEIGEHSTFLGTLSVRSGSGFSLHFAGDSSNGQVGTNLLGAGNVVEITLENGHVQLPTGQVILSATFPPKAFVHIKHLLFSFPTTPGKIGLLVGLLSQSKLLSAQALALQSLVATRNSAGVRCIAQSIIDISEGIEGANYRVPAASCGNSLPIGDSFGILGTNGYASLAATHASLAATQSDTTANIRLRASKVEVGTTDITGWVTTIDQDAVNLLVASDNTATIQEIAALADHAYHGLDLNGNGQIEPLPGEAGAMTAYLQGQLMATLPLIPVPAA